MRYSMPFCKECGKEIENDNKFCPSCGTQNVLFENKIENKKFAQNIDIKSKSQTAKYDGSASGIYCLEDLPKGYIIDGNKKVVIQSNDINPDGDLTLPNYFFYMNSENWWNLIVVASRMHGRATTKL